MTDRPAVSHLLLLVGFLPLFLTPRWTRPKAQSTPRLQPQYETGPEYQILDVVTLGNDGKALLQTGGLSASSKTVTNPVGRYDALRVVAPIAHLNSGSTARNS